MQDGIVRIEPPDCGDPIGHRNRGHDRHARRQVCRRAPVLSVGRSERGAHDLVVDRRRPEPDQPSTRGDQGVQRPDRRAGGEWCALVIEERELAPRDTVRRREDDRASEAAATRRHPLVPIPDDRSDGRTLKDRGHRRRPPARSVARRPEPDTLSFRIDQPAPCHVPHVVTDDVHAAIDHGRRRQRHSSPGLGIGGLPRTADAVRGHGCRDRVAADGHITPGFRRDAGHGRDRERGLIGHARPARLRDRRRRRGWGCRLVIGAGRGGRSAGGSGGARTGRDRVRDEGVGLRAGRASCAGAPGEDDDQGGHDDPHQVPHRGFPGTRLELGTQRPGSEARMCDALGRAAVAVRTPTLRPAGALTAKRPSRC